MTGPVLEDALTDRDLIRTQADCEHDRKTRRPWSRRLSTRGFYVAFDESRNTFFISVLLAHVRSAPFANYYLNLALVVCSSFVMFIEVYVAYPFFANVNSVREYNSFPHCVQLCRITSLMRSRRPARELRIDWMHYSARIVAKRARRHIVFIIFPVAGNACVRRATPPHHLRYRTIIGLKPALGLNGECALTFHRTLPMYPRRSIYP